MLTLILALIGQSRLSWTPLFPSSLRNLSSYFFLAFGRSRAEARSLQRATCLPRWHAESPRITGICSSKSSAAPVSMGRHIIIFARQFACLGRTWRWPHPHCHGSTLTGHPYGTIRPLHCGCIWCWKTRSLAALLALSCELDDFSAVVYTKENFAAKATKSVTSATQHWRIWTTPRSIEEGKGEAYAT